MKIVENNEYIDFLKGINDRIREAQLSALRAVNKELKDQLPTAEQIARLMGDIE